MAVLTTIPLSRRKSDLIFIFVFFNFLIICATVDYINAVGDIGGFFKNAQGQWELRYGITPENTKDALWPPQAVYKAFFWWCDLADETLKVNPVWMKVLAFISPFIYGPFYFFAIFAFIKGRNWIRAPGLMYSAVMTIVLVVCFSEAFFGNIPSQDKTIFAAAYGPYFLFPLFLIARLAPQNPFSEIKVEGGKKSQ